MDYMSVKQAAEALGVTRGRVAQLVEQGVLEADRLGGRTLVVTAESVERRRRENPGPGRPKKNQD